MVIVAGHITVDPEQRESYLAGCMRVVEKARRAAGCLEFAITADLLDPGRVNLFERWESQAAVEAFRGSGPGNKRGAAMLSASVAEYDIADARPLTEGPSGRGASARGAGRVSPGAGHCSACTSLNQRRAPKTCRRGSGTTRLSEPARAGGRGRGCASPA
jgi:quinol monooxygenase YgiN